MTPEATPSRNACRCGRQAAWTLAIADTGADDFRIRPDLCQECYRKLPPEQAAGWRSSLSGMLRTLWGQGMRLLEAAPSRGLKQYVLVVEGRLVWVGVPVGPEGSPENTTGELTEDMVQAVIATTQHRIASQRERAQPGPVGAVVQVAQVSAPFISRVLTDGEARKVLPPEQYEALLGQIRRQERR